MQIYQVGGSVRDKLLQVECNDRDFVVFGSTEEEMEKAGFQKVGKSFPVFLHPETKEEYALARKEIKIGSAHTDFKFIFTPDITIEEDSIRRDFTCNSMYLDTKNNELIDIHGGQKDIKNKILRHVSDHFIEDPLRVLRMCRFAAQLDFDVAEETMQLCTQMVKNGAIKSLSKERIWQEIERAMCFPNFYKFILCAKQCGALKEILPEIDDLWQVPERIDYHPEGNSGEHTILALKSAKSCDSMVNFGVLFHDVGKTQTNPDNWPSHYNHDKYGIDMIKKISRRLKAPTRFSTFASFVIEHHMLYHRPIESIKKELVKVALTLIKNKKNDYQKRFIQVLKADMQGRAIEDFSQQLKDFSIFELHLQNIIQKVEKTPISTIPNFEELIDDLKNNKINQSEMMNKYYDIILS